PPAPERPPRRDRRHIRPGCDFSSKAAGCHHPRPAPGDRPANRCAPPPSRTVRERRRIQNDRKDRDRRVLRDGRSDPTPARRILPPRRPSAFLPCDPKIHEISNTPSPSTATPRGSELAPIAERECRPLSPNTATIKSDAPLATSGWRTKS